MLRIFSEYETTCYIDRNNKIAGKLYVNDNCCIDFDKEDIFLDGVAQQIPYRSILLLERLVVKSPEVFSYEELVSACLGENYDGEAGIQSIRYYKHSVSEYVSIEAKNGRGYLIQLNKIIPRNRQVNCSGYQ